MKKIVETLQALFKRYQDHEVNQMGGQLAYFFILAIFPFLIFANALLGFLNLNVAELKTNIESVLPAEAASLVGGYLESVASDKNTALLSLSLLFALFSASGAVDALINALNDAYGVKETRGFVKRKLLSLIFTVGLAIAIALTLVLPAMGRSVIEPLFGYLQLSGFFVTLWVYVRWVVLAAVLFGMLSLLYYVCPDVKNRYKDTLPGALFSSVMLVVLSIGFALYVNNFANYSRIYGSLGAVIILLLWLYYAGIILILGGELNDLLDTHASLKNRKPQQISPSAKAQEKGPDSAERSFENLKKNLEELEQVSNTASAKKK